MIDDLLGPNVCSAEAFTDPPGVAPLGAENAIVAGAVAKRRIEFATARLCARQALAGLGIAAVPILAGERREPLWPDGVVGSITHCDGYRAAAVARADDVATIGIDAEPHRPLPDGVLEVISSTQERAGLARLAAADTAKHWDRLLFCAKEAVYKAWYPLTGRWLGFDDADVALCPGLRTFTASLHVDTAPVAGFTGNWMIAGGLVLTAIAEPT